MTLVLQVGYLALVIGGAVVAWRRGGDSRAYAALILSIAAYFWVMTTLVLWILRYMVPAMGLLITLIPTGVAEAMLLWRGGNTRS